MSSNGSKHDTWWNDLQVSAEKRKKERERWFWFKNWAPDVRKCDDVLAPPLNPEDPQTCPEPIGNRMHDGVSPTCHLLDLLSVTLL